MKHSDPRLAESLTAYEALLEKYHKTLSLLSTNALANLETKIEDSLVYAQCLAPLTGAYNILDIGSGNGLPAVPMALALPHCTFHLVERRQRRSTFLTIVKSQLNLHNVDVYAESVEQVVGPRVRVVTAMAVGRLVTLYCLSSHLHEDTVTLVCRKGPSFEREVEELETTLETKISDLQTILLKTNGTLVAVQLAGGKTCRS